MNTNRILTALGTCVLCVAVLTACDTLQKDSVQDQDQVKVGNNEIYLTPQSSGIIDLGGMVQSYESVKLSVSGQPRFGKLETLNAQLLRYTPNAGFTRGRDGFPIQIHTSSNGFIKSDSVRIIVSPDSLNLPCGLWAMNDFVHNVNAPIEVDVLNNDKLCGLDRAQLEISLVASPAPSGTATVLANKRILYTPSGTGTAPDKFAYRILKPQNIPNPGDAEKSSYGFVMISRVPGCKDSLVLANDNFRIRLDSINTSDSLRLYPTANDLICRRSTTTFSIAVTQAPTGKVFYDLFPPYRFRYLVPPGSVVGFKDAFKYRICVDDVCREAEVKIELK